MSVLWYYRPEQTEMGKQPHIHGEVSNIGFLCLKQPHIHGEVSNIGFLCLKQPHIHGEVR